MLYSSGCATVPITPPAVSEQGAGTHHRMEKGQTLWSVSKLYNVDLGGIISINHITDVSNIEIGQLILIPEGKMPQNQLVYAQENFIWPLKGKTVSSFGQITNNTVNKGINIQPYGSPGIFASRSGKVIFYSEKLFGFGKTLIIDHGDGFSSVYARNSEVFVKVGDHIQKGALIAKLGKGTGRVRDTYLHFEIRKGHLPQNPSFFLPELKR